MISINDNYTKLAASYLFVEISRRVSEYTAAHPERSIIKLGIGDVTRPLPAAVIAAFHEGVDSQADAASFKGYGPEQGYEFLRSAIAEVDYASRGCRISADEIFVSDGAKCDSGNFQEILAPEAKIGVPDPVYPVYVDSNVMAGRTGSFVDGRYEGLTYLEGTRENGFVPPPPAEHLDVIYLCFPNNPTGVAATRAQLAEWVRYAREHEALILFDAAYEEFIRDEDLPRSIYEIEGAREVAVEFRSLSKTAGFTGTRCAFTVVPQEIRGVDSNGSEYSLRDLWNRRQSTKFNGVSYPVQQAAAAVYSEAGQAEIHALSDYYLQNAALIRQKMESLGYWCTGGEHSPYVWVQSGGSSWDLFDTMLRGAGVVITPGAGFGKMGEGYVRISAFNEREQVEEALERIRKM